MALQAAYKQFLASPNSSVLAGDAELHYVTTTTSFLGSTEIIKHLSSQRNQIKKKKEELLDVVEGPNALAAEVETNLEFMSSGGAYLPELDDNFLADRIVYLPIVHFVSFDGNGKITQIRQSWDQGSLLKQLDIIGKTGRNWPIRDSQDQLSLITKSLKPTNSASSTAPVPSAAPTAASAAAPAASAAHTGGDDIVIRSRGNSSILRDSHATLFGFGSDEEPSALPPPVVSPYAGTRPRQRSFAQILGDESEEEEAPTAASPTTGRAPTQAGERSRSPTRHIAPKIGSHKNFQPNRLFETDEGIAPPTPDTPAKDNADAPERLYRPNPKKFQHFDFADGSAPEDAPKPGAPMETTKGKHSHNWAFDDFATPAKPAARALPRAQDVRHWGNEDDDVSETPVKKPVPPKPRRDAEAHFELIDDGQNGGAPRVSRAARGTGHNKGLGLYENHLFSEDGSATGPEPDARALGNITNLKDRYRTFGAHFDNDDVSQQQTAGGGAQGAKPADGDAAPSKPKVGDDRMKVVRMMEASWATYDDSPVAQKENSKPTDGGGSNESGTANVTKPRGGVESSGGMAMGGDSMGGKKGNAGRGWAIGDESDEEQMAKNAPSQPGKKQGKAQASSFWNV